MWSSSKKPSPGPSSSDQRPAFVKSAEAFCAHIEGAAGSERAGFVRLCLVLLSRMLTDVMELPESGSGAPDETHDVSEDRYDEICQLIKDKFVEGDYYTMMFDPYEIAAQPVVGSVSDDLADIWREVKNGLEALSHGSLENAIALWRAGFDEQWGEQATQVLRPLLKTMARDSVAV